MASVGEGERLPVAVEMAQEAVQPLAKSNDGAKVHTGDKVKVRPGQPCSL